MTEPVNGLTDAGYWKITRQAGGGSFNIPVQTNALGGVIPRVDDSGGALRFYYPDGRRRIFSYAAISSAEYVPQELAPL